MTPEVSHAVDEIRADHPDATVTAVEDGEGGAIVTVDPVDPGPPYVQRESWIKFHITFQYPVADVYPHFVRADLARADGQALGEAMSVGAFRDEPAVQISRKSNRLNPETDTASMKLTKVLEWLASR